MDSIPQEFVDAAQAATDAIEKLTPALEVLKKFPTVEVMFKELGPYQPELVLKMIELVAEVILARTAQDTAKTDNAQTEGNLQ